MWMQPTCFGRYILLERIAAGGMGEVFTAVPINLWGYGKFFALKRILPSLSSNPEFLQRFRDEVRLVLPLNHPNVVQVFEVGRVENELFVAMELVEGQDLRQIMRRIFHRGRRGSLPIPVALYIVKELLAGLHYCHEHRDAVGQELGVVHRDVCPSNVLISYEGTVKLADFGLALSEFKVVKTDPRHLMGHLGYIAPEHMARGSVDHRADIYSAGVLLFELLTGERFLPPGDFGAIFEAKHSPIVVRPSEHRPEVPPVVDLLVAKAVAVDPDQRFATARQFLEEIQRVLARLQPVCGTGALVEAVIEPFFHPGEKQRRLRALQTLDLATLLGDKGVDLEAAIPELPEEAREPERSKEAQGSGPKRPAKREDDTVSYPMRPRATGSRRGAARAGPWSRRGAGDSCSSSSSDEDTLRWAVALMGIPD
jgi:serine/threonine protein kinase